MPFKSFAVKEQALLGAKEYVARVEQDESAYCVGWSGCLLASASAAVTGDWMLYVDAVDDAGSPVLAVGNLLGLQPIEVLSVVSPHDMADGYPRSERAKNTRHQFRRECARSSLAALAAIPVGDER